MLKRSAASCRPSREGTDLHRAFATLDLDPEERPAAAQLERDLNAQLERAATRAFRDSFLIGAGLALIAMLIVVAPRRRRP